MAICDGYLEVSPSSRATCMNCKAKIQSGELRVALNTPSTFIRGTTDHKYLHLECGYRWLEEHIKECSDLVLEWKTTFIGADGTLHRVLVE